MARGGTRVGGAVEVAVGTAADVVVGVGSSGVDRGVLTGNCFGGDEVQDEERTTRRPTNTAIVLDNIASPLWICHHNALYDKRAGNMREQAIIDGCAKSC